MQNKDYMKNILLKKNYNVWWQDKKIHGEKIDAAKRLYRNLINGLLKHHSLQKGKKLLDVACGTGEFMIEASKRGFYVYGIDLSDYAIKHAKKHAVGIFYVGSGENMPFKNNEFDYIVCIGSLEHFSRPDKGIAEMARVLKKDGICVIHVPNLMFLGHIYMAYRYGVMPSEGEQQFSEIFYTYNGWKKLLEDNGFLVIDCTVVNDMSKTKKVSPYVKIIWQYLIRPFVPLHLSYAFNFYCRKK